MNSARSAARKDWAKRRIRTRKRGKAVWKLDPNYTPKIVEEPRIIIEGEGGREINFYKEKSPFLPSGKSVRGAIEYDEAEDKIKCHECGDWFHSLRGTHLSRHGLTSGEYKKKHGLVQRSALIAEGVRQKQIASGLKHHKQLLTPKTRRKWRIAIDRKKRGGTPNHRTMANYNKYNECPPQLLDKIRTVGKTVGHRPNERELAAYGIRIRPIIYHFGSLSRAMDAAGYADQNKHWGVGYTRGKLVSLMRAFWDKYHRLPSPSDSRRGLMPWHGVYARFGGMLRIARLAGIPKEWSTRAGVYKRIGTKRKFTIRAKEALLTQ